MESPIFVTRPNMPSLKEFTDYLAVIWDNRILTNGGDFHQTLEKELVEYLGVKYISLFSNGTLALITALQALRVKGEVITTPFSFVATTHSLWWNGIKPVFVDIDPKTYNIDPEKIEAAITPNTTAILPVHVYGHPCNHKRIEEIANNYNLKVIYDAAHAFGVRENGTSITNYGDLSILSFHATKVFSTIEGGAIICHDAKMKRHIDDLKNFGFRDEVTVVAPGINAKMNEIQAAFGLMSLKNIDETIAKRKNISDLYCQKLSNISGIILKNIQDNLRYNYSYFPILIDEQEYGMSRNQLYEKLKQYNIFSRRYFYPLISDFSTYKSLPSASPKNLPIASSIANQVLCLPIYPDLDRKDIDFICDKILNREK